MVSRTEIQKSTYSLNDKITGDVTVRELLKFFRRMNYRPFSYRRYELPSSFFQHFYLGESSERLIASGLFQTGFDRSRVFVDDKIEVTKRYIREYGGFTHKMKTRWHIDVIFQCSERSFEAVEHEGPYTINIDGKPYRYLNTWFEEDIQKVTLVRRAGADMEADIQCFISEFDDAMNRIKAPIAWSGSGVASVAQCRCGHVKEFDGVAICKSLGLNSMFDLKPKMRCISCGVKGEAEILPWFTPSDAINLNSIRNYLGDDRTIRLAWRSENDFYGPPSQLDRGRGEGRGNSFHRGSGAPDELYSNMGGNGDERVYLADGLYVNPDGSVSED